MAEARVVCVGVWVCGCVQNILAECQHPFVLELLTTYTDREQIYMLMELVQVRARGRSLLLPRDSSCALTHKA
jgi:hypothetical protein